MRHEPSPTGSTCVMVTASGSEGVHLALAQPGADSPAATLCERQVLPTTPTRHFQQAGCFVCAEVSLARGIDCALETAQVVVNLRRFYDWASRNAGPTASSLPA
jgi:hypothetical protein